jgi:phosphoribosyl 1,2-cyclic phosphate phosphodiesterase
MNLTFLGTGAAEGYPALWCRCERCTVARQRGGRSLRFRASMLVNDDLLIDVGPDIVASAVRLGVDLAPVQALLVTHPHSDHLEAHNFGWRRKGFVATPLPLLHIYGSAASVQKMSGVEGRQIDPAALRVEHHRIAAFQRFEVRTGGELAPDPRFDDPNLSVPATPPRRYEVQTVAARHATPDAEPMFFAIRQVEGPEAGGREAPPALLYATDTGPFLDETWAQLDALGVEGWRFDAAIIDSTSGTLKDSTAHMGVAQMTWHQQELARRRLLTANARRIAHHFSHNGTPPYEELSEILAADGIESSFDGRRVDL